MGSRLKENPERTFYWFFEAVCPIARDKDPGLLYQFPEDFNDEESRETLPRFCFPYDIQRVREGVAVQHFTFVLTDLEGCQRFGFCRLANSSQTCLCMLSYLPWFEVFYKLLNNLADYLIKGQTNEMKEVLAALYKQPMPLAAGSVTLQLGEQLYVSTDMCHPVGYRNGQEGIPYFIAPDPRSLPSIPESRNLTELVVAVDVGNLLRLYASMLFERRILIFASKLSTLTACVHALSAVLYPMFWQHIFIPVLPPHLLDYCCAPMPYLIGVHSSLAEKVRGRGLEEVVILNVDTNTLETPFDDLKSLPSDVISGLKVRLKRQAASPGWGVARAFLRAQALLFGGYRDALQGHEEGEVWFSEDLFLDHRSPSMRQFLEGAVHLQFFKQFIDGRLELVNQGKEPDDLFEEEIVQCRTAAGGTKPYQQLVGNLKKGGGALILNMKSKANRKAKGFTKRGLKNLLIPKDHNEARTLQRGGSETHRRAQSDCLQNRLPITQHFGMSRPRRPVLRHRAAREEDDTEDNRDTWDGAVSGAAAETDSDLQKDEEEEEEEEEGEDSLLCDPEEMDLLGEIFETLSSRSLHERGLLYSTRSLDLFGPDSHDFIRERRPAMPSQESLSLSINGSGSLHSWNLEEGLQATEEESELAKDSGWLSLDPSAPEEGESESPPVVCELGGRESELSKLGEEKEKSVKQEETEAGMYIKQEINNERTNNKEAKLKEEEKKVKQEEKAHSGEKNEEEKVENRENEGSLGNQVDERDRDEEVEERGEIERGRRVPVRVQGDLVREAKGEESQEGEKDAEMVEDLPRDRLMRLGYQSDRHPNSVEVVEEHEGQDGSVNTTTTASPGALNLTAAPQCKPPMAQEEGDEVGGGAEEGEVAQTSCPPKVLSAVARFQSQASGQGLYMKFQTRSVSETGRCSNMPQSWKNLQSCPTKNSSITLDAGGLSDPAEAEAPPSIKVSQLKKRFEA